MTTENEDRRKRLARSLEYLTETRRISNGADLARDLCKPKSYISEVLSGKRAVTDRFARTFTERYPEISRRWLTEGTGEMTTLPEIRRRIASFLTGKGIAVGPGTGPDDIWSAAGWIECITHVFPECSPEWLLHGDNSL